MYKITSFYRKYEFVFLNDEKIKLTHPISDYFLKINDLSVNLLISLKLILWGNFFLMLILKELKFILYNYVWNGVTVDSIQL